MNIENISEAYNSLEYLTGRIDTWKSLKDRISMTISCHDCDYIPRVKEAGITKQYMGTNVQVMHNGLYVKKDGYQGEWQANVIRELKGMHEPQEEKVFYEVLKCINEKSTMIELGSWWSYYTMWFLKEKKMSKGICCEPDPDNILLGMENAKLNSLDKRIKFINVASGSKDTHSINFRTENQVDVQVPVRSIDSIISEEKINKVDILHMDIQGAELSALKGSLNAIRNKKIRFVIISTHHYAISGDPLIHQKCLEFIKKNGGHIIAKHTVAESCSGDGLIVASFMDIDKEFKVNISYQPTDESLFRSPDIDVGLLWNSRDDLRQKVIDQTSRIEKLNNQLTELKKYVEEKNDEIAKLNNDFSNIATLRKHIKRSAKVKLQNIKNNQK